MALQRPGGRECEPAAAASIRPVRLTPAGGACEGRKHTGKEAAVASEDKIREGARPFMQEGEEVLAAFVARPRGWTQSNAGSMHLGLHQQGKSRDGADAAGFALASPMALAITGRRLLSFSMGAQAGMGIGGGVKELVGEAPLAERILVETALAMIDVIRADEHTRFDICAADDCEGLVLDLSRNRSRRYCSTACGNREAVAAYRARQKA